jgi:hypothetical protein
LRFEGISLSAFDYAGRVVSLDENRVLAMLVEVVPIPLILALSLAEVALTMAIEPIWPSATLATNNITLTQ